MSAGMRFVTDLSKGILGESDSQKFWTEISSHIPDSVLVKPDVKILNVAFGHGTEADILAKRMLDLGVPAKKVKDSIYLVDKYRVFTNRAVRKGYTNVVTADFLEWNPEMKFDVIVGNPPYQNKNQILWREFTDKAVSLCENNGFIAFVTPNSWATGAKNNVFTEIFQKKNTLVINMNGSKYFPKIGKDIGYWVLQNSKKLNLTTIVHDDSDAAHNIDLNSVPFFIRKFNLISLSIFKKIQLKKSFWTEFVERKPKYRREFAFPKIRYNGGYKYGYRYDNKDYNFPTSPVVLSLDMTNYSLAEVENLNNLFSSKLYRFLWEIYGASDAGSFGWILRNMPKVSLKHRWTDQDLYARFNLTQEEIEYIENAVK